MNPRRPGLDAAEPGLKQRGNDAETVVGGRALDVHGIAVGVRGISHPAHRLVVLGATESGREGKRNARQAHAPRRAHAGVLRPCRHTRARTRICRRIPQA